MPFDTNQSKQTSGLAEAARIIEDALAKRGTGKVMLTPERAARLTSLIRSHLASGLG